MDLPFTTAEFFGVFASYNQAVWPAQFVWLAAAAAVLLAMSAGWSRASRGVLILLAGLWLWMGVIYHGVFFRVINPAAVFFAALFLVQALILLAAGVRNSATIRPSRSAPGIIGAVIISYALLFYPILGYALGHRFPASPTFGLPCPTTLFTLGVLLWSKPLKWGLLIIPLIWSGIGSIAALRLGVYEDIGLSVAGLATVIALVFFRRPGALPGSGQRVAA